MRFFHPPPPPPPPPPNTHTHTHTHTHTLPCAQVCTPVTQCWTTATDMAGQYTSAPATLEDDVQCTPLSAPCDTLSPPHYQSSPATPTTDRVCAPQPPCVPPFTFEAVPPTSTTERVCMETTDCGDDLALVSQPTCVNEISRPFLFFCTMLCTKNTFSLCTKILFRFAQKIRFRFAQKYFFALHKKYVFVHLVFHLFSTS
jgi:hypothetical protein